MRISEIKRKTNETDISVTLNIDGSGKSKVDTGIGFLNHMLELFARHGRFDLAAECKGDTDVDFHHTVEDIGICIGKAFAEALGERRGIKRYGGCVLPMDEALVQTAVDLGGRPHLSFGLSIPVEKVGDFDTQLVEEFMTAFIRNSGAAVHMIQLAGTNGHHIIEAAFKCFARALSEACEIDPRAANEIPSTKGVI